MKCYICRKQISEDNGHPFYKRMCKECGEKNWNKRLEHVSLWGYTALVTGGRIKIGYETSLKLLRSGAFVVVTTRFPVDAVNRYCTEKDFLQWCDRLVVYQIDFRRIQSVYSLIEFMNDKLLHLDILVNNAAQTVRHTCDYYNKLVEIEETGYESLPEHLKVLIVRQEDSDYFIKIQKSSDNMMPLFLEGVGKRPIQQNTKKNSWTSKACDISVVEMLEVQLINTTTPFLLCTELRHLMRCSPHKYKYIINVSSVEGQFSKENKNCFHPHTNMAKASLNMLTRTSAQDFFTDGIIMNSVDTGWITDENPDWIRRKNEKNGYKPPLDSLDGASRICDPIFSSITYDCQEYGLFYKDYMRTGW